MAKLCMRQFLGSLRLLDHQLVLPDGPPAWPSVSFPPPSPTTLGFSTGCLNPNPSSPAPGQFTLPGFSVNPPSPQAPPVSSTLLSPPCNSPHPSGSFTGIPSVAESLPSASTPPLANPPSQERSTESCGNLVAEDKTTKKTRCFRTKEVDSFLKLKEDIRLGETMDFADRVLVDRIQGRNYTVACLRS